MIDRSQYDKSSAAFRNDARILREMLEARNADSSDWEMIDGVSDAMNLIADAIDEIANARDKAVEFVMTIPTIAKS